MKIDVKKRGLRSYHWYVIVLICVFSCDEKPARVKSSGLYNPYEASFYGKGIKFMLNDAGRGFTDTTTFDRDGNICKVQIFQHEKFKKAFDRHNVTRLMEEGEFFKHFIITYDTVENYIIKEMQEISNLKWDIDTSDMQVRNTYYQLYRKDETGKIVEEIDTDIDKCLIYYIYKNDKLIEKKEVYILGEGRAYEDNVKRWKFFYRYDVLDKIEMYFGNTLNSTQYFDEKGLLKFTTQISKPGFPEDTIYHRYVYY